MRIVIATDVFPPQIIGSSTVVYNLARGLASKGHSVSIFAPSYKGFHRIEEIEGIKVYRFASVPLPYFKEVKTSITPITIFERMRRIKPDIVHTHHPFIIGRSSLMAAKRLHIPTVTTNHMLPEAFLMLFPMANSFDRYKSEFNPTWKFIIGFLNRANVVISPTESGLAILKTHGLKPRSAVISNGVDHKKFNPKNDGKYLRDKYSLPYKPIILYTGRLSEEKRVDVLIKSIPYVLKRIDAHFLIVGEGLHKKGLEKLSRTLKIRKNITFTGFLNDRDYPDVYSVGDIYVMPSMCELQSITTLEALASGLPVIAARKYALPELVRVGENGYLFEPSNYQDLAEKIVKLLSNNEINKMREKSLEIAKNHSLKRSIEKYEEIYEMVKGGE
jgi:glycosyltransferase involved in cell wall biosynthesis